MIVSKRKTGRNSVVKKRCENQLNPIDVKKVPSTKCVSSVVLNEAIPHIGYNKYNFLNIRFIPLFTASHHNAVDDL
jgi:hypothetical protein